jgi:hypothetical protein
LFATLSFEVRHTLVLKVLRFSSVAVPTGLKFTSGVTCWR